MSLTPLTVKTGGSIAVTGGPNQVFGIVSNGNGQIKLADNAATDLRLQQTITIKVSQPRPNKSMPNGYTMARIDIKYVVPFILANGNRQTNTVQVVKSFDVETSSAQHVVLNDMFAQLGFTAAMLPALNLLNLG
jgi:hypothetical protein